MTASDFRIQLRDMRGRLCRDESIDGETFCAASDWVSNQLAEMDQEKEKTRRLGRIPLRSRLKVLLVSILSHSPFGGKVEGEGVHVR